MNWVQLGGSLAAVLLLAGIAWALKLGRGRGGGVRLDHPTQAMDEAEAVLPGFRAVAAVLGTDGRSGLVSGHGDRVAVIKAHGARLAVREIGWPAVRATGDGVVVETAERLFGRVPLTGVDALDVRRLAPRSGEV